MYIISSQKEYEVVIESVIESNNKPQPKAKRGFFDKFMGIKSSEIDN